MSHLIKLYAVCKFSYLCLWYLKEFFDVPYFSAYKTEAFPFQNKPKNLDPSYKMDLDF